MAMRSRRASPRPTSSADTTSHPRAGGPRMTNLLQALVSGLALGGIYALVALGFSITHTTTRTLNFGQGEFLVGGAFVGVATLLLLAGKGPVGVLTPPDVSLWRYSGALLASVVVL